jgi:hypothetical protein
MRPIPPPCPVDDAPHTTCTSPDYVPSAPIVIPQLPCRDAMPTGPVSGGVGPVEPQPVVPPSDVPTGFTTSTYRRELHGAKRRRP